MSVKPGAGRTSVLPYAGPERPGPGNVGVWWFLFAAAAVHVAIAVLPLLDYWVFELYILVFLLDVAALPAGGLALWQGVRRRTRRPWVPVAYCAAMAALAAAALLLVARNVPKA